jgi:O-antigen biosynthesis protein WbqP
MILIVILIRLTSRGSAIFRQKRVGKNKKLFTIYKFRTMRKNTPNIPTRNFTNSASFVTPLGRVLRKTSLDELPQLFNILFGSMTVVGPRPPLYNEDEQVEERDKYGINKLRPGLTGWAQINGRNESDLLTKTKYDAEYLVRASLWFDFKIMVITFFQVIRGKNVKVGLTEDKAGKPAAEVTVTPEDIARVEAVYDNEVNIQFEKSVAAEAAPGNDLLFGNTAVTVVEGAVAGNGGGGGGQDSVFDLGGEGESHTAEDIADCNKE